MDKRHITQAKRTKSTKLQHKRFGAPFILAYVIWRWFPILAEHVIVHGFGYTPTFQPTHWLWHATVWFFYLWYTFLSIVIGGGLLVAAWIWKRKQVF